jgi:putative hydrolase of the HAD superfamily
VIWDFDGTLARRIGNWRGAMIEVLDEHHGPHRVTMEQLSPLIHNRFPWDQAEVEHHELSDDPDVWWAPMEAVLADAYRGVGHADRAEELAGHVRRRFVDHRYSWEVFADTVPALERLSAEGWEHVVLSNHVPELPLLISGLGLEGRFRAVITSALIGYEKPHPEAFRLALEAAGHPEQVWMVGDNPVADVQGAEAVGIPALRVRTGGYANLEGVVARILGA